MDFGDFGCQDGFPYGKVFEGWIGNCMAGGGGSFRGG